MPEPHHAQQEHQVLPLQLCGGFLTTPFIAPGCWGHPGGALTLLCEQGTQVRLSSCFRASSRPAPRLLRSARAPDFCTQALVCILPEPGSLRAAAGGVEVWMLWVLESRLQAASGHCSAAHDATAV